MARYRKTRRGWHDAKTGDLIPYDAYRDDSFSSGWRHITGRPAKRNEIEATKRWEKRNKRRARPPKKAARRKPSKKRVKKRQPPTPPPPTEPGGIQFSHGGDATWQYFDGVEDAIVGDPIQQDGILMDLLKDVKKYRGQNFTWEYQLDVETTEGRRRSATKISSDSYFHSKPSGKIEIDRRRRPDLSKKVEQTLDDMASVSNEFLNSLYRDMTGFIVQLKRDYPLLYDDLRRRRARWVISGLTIEVT